MNTDFPVVYLLIYIVILFLHLGNSVIKKNEYLKHFLFRALWIFLAIFSGTRVCVGGDWIGYGDLFKSQEDIEFNFISDDPTEVIFRFIAYISSNAGFSFEVFNLIISCLTCYFLYRGIWSLNKNNAFLFTLLYFSVMYFNQQFGIIRNGLAVSIYFYSLSFLNNKKKYLGLGLINYNIHNTSAFPVLMTLILNNKINKYFAFVIFFLTLFLIFKSDLLLNSLLSFLDITNSKYINYADAAVRYLEKTRITNTTFIITGIFLFYLYKKITIDLLFVNLTGFYIIVNLIFPYHAILGRLNAFLLIPVWMFIFKFMDRANIQTKIFITTLLVLYSSLALSLIFFDKDLALFRQYQTWLFDFNLSFDQCSTEFQY
ncbi:MAG: EpsG family protein [Sphingomonadales bacterium]|nr:EpsG family protein [Sphingomonadales bacterium]